MGRVDSVPSRVTGRTLTYFSPDPFPDLLNRYAAWTCDIPAREPVVSSSFGSAPEALMLARGALSFRSERSRREEARALVEVLAAHPPPRMDRAELLSLGLFGAQAPRQLRCEVAFSGARVASDGHVFAYEGDVEPLFDSLCEGLVAPPAQVSTTVLAACAAFHALHVHPFVDGNGRWARLLAARIGSTRGDVASGVVHACLLQMGKSVLAERHWPHARSHGLADYLARCLAFEARVLVELDSRGLTETMSAIHAGICATVVSPRLRAPPLSSLIADGRIHRIDLKRVACLSTRALDGALLRMAERSGCEIDRTTGDLDAAPLMAQVDDVLAATLRACFHD